MMRRACGFTSLLAFVVASAGVAVGCRPAATASRGAVVTGQAERGLSASPPSWQSPLDRDHPLVGKIWQSATQTMVDASAVAAALAQADFILLGEKHDNPDHHRLQADAILSIVRAGRRPTLALEMLEPLEDAIVERYRAGGSGAPGLGAALGWEKSGWPPWPTYLPIADVAFTAGLPLVSANLPRDVVRGIARHGTGGLDPQTIARLGLDRPLAPALEASLQDELRASHCGQLPEAMVGPMALAQRARDGQMADRMLAATGPVVLIAGAGHVRSDRGVPPHLLVARPGARMVSVGFVEVEQPLHMPEAYAARFGAPRLPFDFVWFTPRANDDDPCADFHMHRP
jgi:uncharacterized iron-regulated protein